MKSRLNINIFIILAGLLWGLTELTGGYFLHLLKAPVAGALLMPVGVLCMAMVYGRSSRKSSIVLVSLIAASVKLVTIFFVPAASLYLVINPVVAIVLQGLIMIIPVAMIADSKSHGAAVVFVSFYAAIVLYKLAFITFQIVLKVNTGAPALGGLNIAQNSGFLFVETLISTIIITGSLFVAEMLNARAKRVRS